jgi:hypothetical protein
MHNLHVNNPTQNPVTWELSNISFQTIHSDCLGENYDVPGLYLIRKNIY